MEVIDKYQNWVWCGKYELWVDDPSIDLYNVGSCDNECVNCPVDLNMIANFSHKNTIKKK